MGVNGVIFIILKQRYLCLLGVLLIAQTITTLLSRFEAINRRKKPPCNPFRYTYTIKRLSREGDAIQ